MRKKTKTTTAAIIMITMQNYAAIKLKKNQKICLNEVKQKQQILTLKMETINLLLLLLTIKSFDTSTKIFVLEIT